MHSDAKAVNVPMEMLAVRRIQLSPEWVSSQFIHGRVSSIGVAFFYFAVAWIPSMCIFAVRQPKMIPCRATYLFNGASSVNRPSAVTFFCG